MTHEQAVNSDCEALYQAKKVFVEELAAMAQTIVDQARTIAEYQAQKQEAQDQLRIELERRRQWECERAALLEKLAIACCRPGR